MEKDDELWFDDDDGGVGTTNIVSIFGGKIHIAVDGRVSHKGLIRNEKYQKLVKLKDLEIHLTVCGGIKQHERMQKHVGKKMEGHKNITVALISQWATDYFRDTSIKYKIDRVGQESDKKDVKLYEEYEERLFKWTFHYHNTSAFVCGFDKDGIPKVYLANDRFEKALDMSKQYTTDQIKNGIKEHEILLAIDASYPYHRVRGSYTKGVREFMDTSPTFKRINETFRLQNPSDLDAMDAAMNRFSMDVPFETLSLEYAKTIVYATIHDPFTGGEIIVKQLSRQGICPKKTYKAMKVYFECFKELEGHDVLFMILDTQDYSKENDSAILKYFEGLHYGEVRDFHAIGFLNGYVLYRLRFEINQLESLELVYQKVLENNIGKGKFGMVKIEIGNFSLSAGRPTEDMLKFMLKRF